MCGRIVDGKHVFIQILFVIRQFNIGCLFPFPIVVDADLECVVGFGTAVEAAFITDDFVFQSVSFETRSLSDWIGYAKGVKELLLTLFLY